MPQLKTDNISETIVLKSSSNLIELCNFIVGGELKRPYVKNKN